MKNLLKKTGKFLLTGILTLSTLITSVPSPVRANDVNVVGDVAVRGDAISNTYSSFQWSSIPGYRPTSAKTYSLVDSNGDVHGAVCIDSTLADGVGEDLPMTMIGEESGTLRSGAVSALLNGNVTASNITFTVPEVVGRGGFLVREATTETATVSRSNMQMAMRWLSWTTVDHSATGAWRTDMINLVADEIPTLYFNDVRYKEWVTDIAGGETIHDAVYLSEKKEVNERADGNYEKIVRKSVEVTPENYTNVITDAVQRTTYENILNSIAQQVRNRVEGIARNFAGNKITIWQGRTDRQRFATVSYIEQNTKISVKKASSNPELTNGNSKYNLAGIKYGLYRADNNEYIGEFSLNADGSSNQIETKAVKPNDQVYIQEIDDATRKASGYKLNPNKVYHTITKGENVINTTDIPMDDPFVIELFKYDNKTGKKYDKIGV